MRYIYSPNRDKYFDQKVDGCVFCNILNSENDNKNFILFRDTLCFGLMNLYPYNPGHFMIIPNQHIDNVENLDDKTWLQMNMHVKSGIKMLKEELGAAGVNIGMNLGDEAGAGIGEHIHAHIVPRWVKDTNFITTIGQIRIIPSDFERTYKTLLSLVPKYFKLNI